MCHRPKNVCAVGIVCHRQGLAHEGQRRTRWVQLVGHHARFLGCLNLLRAGSVSEVACHEGLEQMGAAGRQACKDALAVLHRLQTSAEGGGVHMHSAGGSGAQTGFGRGQLMTSSGLHRLAKWMHCHGGLQRCEQGEACTQQPRCSFQHRPF